MLDVYDVATGAKFGSIALTSALQSGNTLAAPTADLLDLSPDGTILAVRARNDIVLLDALTLAPRALLLGPDGKVMKEADYSTMKPTDAAKTISYLAKMVDEVVRLMEFAKGAPDSRSEVVGLSDLLKVLTQEQFYQLQDWIAAGKAKVVNEPGYQA